MTKSGLLKRRIAALCCAAAGLAAHAAPAAECSGRILNPVTDVCWSCLFPVKIAGGVPVSASGALPDPQVSVPPVCVCGKGTNLRAGITMSFWEPLRTAEIVRHPGCLPTMGGVSLGDLGLRVSAHSKVHAKTDDGSMRRHTAFWQVHWYNTPWLFVLEALLDQSCLEQMPWDLAYLSELDPLWDDTLASFLLAPEAALFANPAAQGACAADCLSASMGLPMNSLYWCSGCQGSVFPLTGWTASTTSYPAAWTLLSHRFAMKLAREGLLWSAHGENGLCGPYWTPILRKDVWRTEILYPTRGDKSGNCCQPLGRTTVVSGAGRSFTPGGEDGAVLLWRRRDCCVTTSVGGLAGGTSAAAARFVRRAAEAARRPAAPASPIF